jgi:U32 family peptidase
MSELLAPAGNFEKLKWASLFGADAVYFGMKDFSLRSYAGNFSLDEAKKGTSFLHSQNKKSYVTLNIYPKTNEYSKILSLAKKLEDINVDAFIVSDLGLINFLIKNTKVPIHISTQANTLNAQTILFYKDLGVKRVNLARELSIKEIIEIQKEIKNKIETEVFIHGAVCFSMSGRCAISDYMTGRIANRGECTHPCRWSYSLVEETRPNKYYPVFEDTRGTYFFNNKDLALFPFIKDLLKAKVSSLKIEGRMKTIHYIATVTSFYRNILDGKDISIEEGLKYLSRVNSRGYSFGFMKGNIDNKDYNFNNDVFKSSSTFVANTEEDKRTLRLRNRVIAGEELEVLSPGGNISKITLPNLLLTSEGETKEICHNDTIIKLDFDVPSFSILRRVKKGIEYELSSL